MRAMVCNGQRHFTFENRRRLHAVEESLAKKGRNKTKEEQKGR